MNVRLKMVTKKLFCLLFLSLCLNLKISSGGILSPTLKWTNYLQYLRKNFAMNFDFHLKKMGIPRITSRQDPDNIRRCYDTLGCLEISEDWYGVSRPVNVLPESREEINTRFFLRTNKNRHGVFILPDVSSVTSSTFNSSLPTKMIIHGYIDDGFVPWIEDMSSLLLNMDDFNVISVDWGTGSVSLYSQAVGNTRLVGLEIAHLINILMENFGAKPEDFHLIGHSLGAHTAGYAGEKIQELTKQKLGRISALDPAEPFFRKMPTFVRLDKEDAEFVDVIHTDAKGMLSFGYGMVDPIGHVDFYPNGGKNQPGCSLTDFPVSMTNISDPERTADSISRYLVACSHTRAIELYLESLKPGTCSLMGHECDSYEDFKSGLCFDCNSTNCLPLGYESIKISPLIDKESKSRKFYLTTEKSGQFCHFTYLLEIELGTQTIPKLSSQGVLEVRLYDESGITVEKILTEEKETFDPGETRKFLISVTSDVRNVTQVELFWEFVKPSWYPCIWFCDSRLLVRKLTLTSDQSGSLPSTHRITLCNDDIPIESEAWSLFSQKC